jgi:tetratricopeptide (TPR) repeat protein
MLSKGLPFLVASRARRGCRDALLPGLRLRVLPMDVHRMRMKRLARCMLFLAVAGALTFAEPALSQDVLGQARALMEKRDAKGAYELLKPLEGQRAGDADYDYLLGLAAIDAGKPTEAVFALERVLAVNPNHPQARAEIARAYFVLGENETAKREFEAVRKQAGTPTEVNATIQKFLDAIDQVRASQGRQITGYMEVTLGHDTNVNAGTSNG